ncbi:hypothetical protein ACVBGC_32205 [Burkholderia stagnalis]
MKRTPDFRLKWPVTLMSVLSLAAAAVSAWFAHVAISSNERIYRPYVVATQQFDASGKKIGIYLSNAGLGPAILKDIVVTVGDKRYSGPGTSIWPRFASDMGVADQPCFRSSWPRPDDAMKAGEDLPLFALSDFAPPECRLTMLKLLTTRDISIEVKFESVHGAPSATTRVVRITDPEAMRTAAQYESLEQQIAAMTKAIEVLRMQAETAATRP